MPITMVSYAYIEPGGVPPQMVERQTTNEVREYLDAHVSALVTKATSGALHPAVFRSAEANTRFNSLAIGDNGQFLAASQEIADRMFAAMDQRAKRGFFVTLQLADPATGAVLKLDVRDAAAAALRHDSSGAPSLEAVQDLLDIPGELHKGAVVPDSRAGSEIVVGDKLAVTSVYFLTALDVEQQAAPGPATAEFLRVIQEVAPARAAAAAAALEQESRTTVDEFRHTYPDLLSDAEWAEVADRSRVRRRPIDEIDPEAYALREEIEADGITIRGRSSSIREKLQITPRPGGYRIQIDVEEPPRRRFI